MIASADYRLRPDTDHHTSGPRVQGRTCPLQLNKTGGLSLIVNEEEEALCCNCATLVCKVSFSRHSLAAPRLRARWGKKAREGMEGVDPLFFDQGVFQSYRSSCFVCFQLSPLLAVLRFPGFGGDTQSRLWPTTSRSKSGSLGSMPPRPPKPRGSLDRLEVGSPKSILPF
jgi:hypothetical protein